MPPLHTAWGRRAHNNQRGPASCCQFGHSRVKRKVQSPRGPVIQYDVFHLHASLAAMPVDGVDSLPRSSRRRRTARLKPVGGHLATLRVVEMLEQALVQEQEAVVDKPIPLGEKS